MLDAHDCLVLNDNWVTVQRFKGFRELTPEEQLLFQAEDFHDNANTVRNAIIYFGDILRKYLSVGGKLQSLSTWRQIAIDEIGDDGVLLTVVPDVDEGIKACLLWGNGVRAEARVAIMIMCRHEACRFTGKEPKTNNIKKKTASVVKSMRQSPEKSIPQLLERLRKYVEQAKDLQSSTKTRDALVLQRRLDIDAFAMQKDNIISELTNRHKKFGPIKLIYPPSEEFHASSAILHSLIQSTCMLGAGYDRATSNRLLEQMLDWMKPVEDSEQETMSPGGNQESQGMWKGASVLTTREYVTLRLQHMFIERHHRAAAVARHKNVHVEFSTILQHALSEQREGQAKEDSMDAQTRRLIGTRGYDMVVLTQTFKRLVEHLHEAEGAATSIQLLYDRMLQALVLLKKIRAESR